MYHATYRFFDAPFTVESDDPDFLARFDRSYGPLRAAADPAAPIYRVRLRGPVELDLDGVIWRAADPAALGLFAHSAILNATAARVRSHFMLHAAALAAPDGTGTIIAGDAGLGKTTLALALLHRGYRLFSDDVAAIGCADGRLYPFPRAVAVRAPSSGPDDKHILDADDPVLDGAFALAPCPAGRLFLLAADAQATAPAGWTIVLDRTRDPLLWEMCDLPGVRAVLVGQAGPYPAVTLDLAGAADPELEPAIHALCRRHAILPLDIGRGPLPRPDFGRPPRLTSLTPGEAAEGLLRHLKGGAAAAVLTERFGGRAAQLFMALAALTDRMACYRLVVGHLEATVNLIAGAKT
ncbi:MAG: hypothetical protein N2439_08485 [Anaerolineae bacterium]|nr:hypothetical protein [Anaerolineae bacterium]